MPAALAPPTRPRRSTARPRSSSMYDTPSELHHRLFASSANSANGPTPPQVQTLTNTRVKTLRNGTPVWKTESPYHPYILNNASETHLPHANKSQPNLRATSKVKVKVKAKSSEKLPRSRKSSGAKSGGPPPRDQPPAPLPSAFVPPQMRNDSKGSLKSTGSNPEVERVLAKPTLLKGGTGPRPRASTMDATAARLSRQPPVPVDVSSEEDEEEWEDALNPGRASDVSTGTFGVIKGKATSGTAFFGETPPVSRHPLLQVNVQDVSTGSGPPSSSSNHPKQTTQGYPTPYSPLSPNLLHPPLSPALSTASSFSMYSSDALSIPAFYKNPRASPLPDDSSDSTDRRSIDTLKTLDTMAGAIRGLGPACTPTIDEMRTRSSKRDRDRERRKRRRESHIDVPAPAPTSRNAREGLETVDENSPPPGLSGSLGGGGAAPANKGKGRGVDAEHAKARAEAETRARDLVTPSPLVMSPNMVGFPPLASRRSSMIQQQPTPRVVGGKATRTVAPTKNKLVVVNRDPTDSELSTPVPPAAEPSSTAATTASTPKAVARKPAPKIPPPLTLAPPLSARQRKINRRQSKASSIAVPLSPAPSTVSTIAAIISGRPKRPSEKELRRRRFMKLTRTLGEDIPPELLVNNVAGNGVRGHSLVVESSSRPVGVGARESRNVGGGAVGGAGKAGGIPGMVWARHSIAGDELTSPNPRLSASFDVGSPEKLSSGSPNVLRKFPSIRRKEPPRLVVSTAAKGKGAGGKAVVDAPPLASPLTPDSQPPSSAQPYFENHPFRVVIEDTDGPSPYPSSMGTFAPLHPNGHPRRHSHAQRDSVYSVRDDIPWMRASLALPIAFETPFIEYAGIAGIMRDVGERGVSPGLLDVGGGGLEANGVYRREKRQGWSGEWNQPHIQDVIQKLRQL